MNAMNDSLTHVETIMPLISLMSAHFLLNSYNLISDMEPGTSVNFMKSASKYYLEVHQGKLPKRVIVDSNTGYIVYDEPDFDFSKVFKTKPKLVVGIYRTNESTPLSLKFFRKLTIPPAVSFFVVFLPQNDSPPRCFRLYRPSTRVSPKIFPLMRYGEESNPKWVWETKQTDWNSFQKETLNMSEVTIKIALASHLEKKIIIERFWAGKNSFFWKEMQEHLKFRAVIHFHLVSLKAVRSVGSIYLGLISTIADGLAVLPVITPERFQLVDCILTGLDSKYHIIIRTPQYVHSWQSVLKPFASDSWICLGAAILLLTTALKIVTYYQKISTKDTSSCFLTIFGFICSQGCPDIPKTLSARIICYTSIFFSILIYQFYTSNFYSLLSTKEVTLPFTSLEQFVSRKTHSMYVHPDTAIYDVIKNSKSGILKKIWDEFLSKDPNHQLKSSTREKLFERVCKGKAAIFGLPFQTAISQNCKMVTVNSGYFPTSIVTVVRKNFPFKSQFQFTHLKLLESGVTHKFRDDKMTLEQQYGKTEVINEPVSLEHVAFLFAFHAGFVVLSWLLLGVEIILSKTFKGRKTLLKGRINKML